MESEEAIEFTEQTTSALLVADAWRVATSDPEPRDDAERRSRWDREVTVWLAEQRPNTRAAYRRSLAMWTGFLTTLPAPCHPVDADARHGRAFRIWLRDGYRTHRGRPLSASSQAQRLAAISACYRGLAAAAPALTLIHPLDGVRRPKVPIRPATPYLDTDEARVFLTAASNVSARAEALAWLLLVLGLRVGEVLGANVSDLQPAAGGRVRLAITRKGSDGATLTDPLPPPVEDAIRRHLAVRSAAGTSLLVAARSAAVADLPLLGGSSGPMTRHEIRREVERICRFAGWDPGRVTAHGLRHTAGTLALETTRDVRRVQRFLGHRQVTTTEGYLHEADDARDGLTDRLAKMLLATADDPDSVDRVRA